MMNSVIEGTERRIKINKEIILELDYVLQTERNTYVQTLICNEVKRLKNWNKRMSNMYGINL